MGQPCVAKECLTPPVRAKAMGQSWNVPACFGFPPRRPFCLPEIILPQACPFFRVQRTGYICSQIGQTLPGAAHRNIYPATGTCLPRHRLVPVRCAFVQAFLLCSWQISVRCTSIATKRAPRKTIYASTGQLVPAKYSAQSGNPNSWRLWGPNAFAKPFIKLRL